MFTKGNINWKETLASIATDKGELKLAEYIRSFDVSLGGAGDYTGPSEVFQQTSTDTTPKVDYSGLSNSTFTITKMPEATCDGCQ